MKMRSLMLFGLLSLPLLAHAQQPSPEVIRQKVARAATAYASAIACDAQENPQNIVPLVPYTDMDNRFEALYAVIWQGDIGCGEGPGTGNDNILVVKIGMGDNYMVDVQESSPMVPFYLPARFSRVLRHNRDSITVETLEHGPRDANCCPTVKKQVRMRRDSRGHWGEAK
ncbi:MAG: hypothetical protein Q4B94_07990 [Pseudomonadota bacterium]|nr:hypothetical protein [Pseudomonadota bacterium]